MPYNCYFQKKNWLSYLQAEYSNSSALNIYQTDSDEHRKPIDLKHSDSDQRLRNCDPRLS